MRLSSTSTIPFFLLHSQPASPLMEPKKIQYLSNPPSKSRDSKDMKPGGGVQIHPVAPADHRGKTTRTSLEETGMYCNIINKKLF